MSDAKLIDEVLLRRTKPGLLLVVSAPSGTGKTTLCHRLVDSLPEAEFSISHTTRPPSRQEIDGVDYHFVDEPVFLRLRDAGGFAEWAQVYDRYYGTARQNIDRALASGRVLVLDIDIAGASQIRAAYAESVSVFVLPPSLEELERRLQTRGRDNAGDIERRLGLARQEMASAGDFDYVLINDDLEQTYAALEAIVVAERCRVGRTAAWTRRLVDSLRD